MKEIKFSGCVGEGRHELITNAGPGIEGVISALPQFITDQDYPRYANNPEGHEMAQITIGPLEIWLMVSIPGKEFMFFFNELQDEPSPDWVKKALVPLKELYDRSPALVVKKKQPLVLASLDDLVKVLRMIWDCVPE